MSKSLQHVNTLAQRLYGSAVFPFYAGLGVSAVLLAVASELLHAEKDSPSSKAR
jgi:hypothetical protein